MATSALGVRRGGGQIPQRRVETWTVLRDDGKRHLAVPVPDRDANHGPSAVRLRMSTSYEVSLV